MKFRQQIKSSQPRKIKIITLQSTPHKTEHTGNFRKPNSASIIRTRKSSWPCPFRLAQHPNQALALLAAAAILKLGVAPQQQKKKINLPQPASELDARTERKTVIAHTRDGGRNGSGRFRGAIAGRNWPFSDANSQKCFLLCGCRKREWLNRDDRTRTAERDRAKKEEVDRATTRPIRKVGAKEEKTPASRQSALLENEPTSRQSAEKQKFSTFPVMAF